MDRTSAPSPTFTARPGEKYDDVNLKHMDVNVSDMLIMKPISIQV